MCLAVEFELQIQIKYFTVISQHELRAHFGKVKHLSAIHNAANPNICKSNRGQMPVSNSSSRLAMLLLIISEKL